MSLKQITIFKILIRTEFKFFGNYLDEVLETFGESKKVYGLNGKQTAKTNQDLAVLIVSR